MKWYIPKFGPWNSLISLSSVSNHEFSQAVLSVVGVDMERGNATGLSWEGKLPQVCLSMKRLASPMLRGSSFT